MIVKNTKRRYRAKILERRYINVYSRLNPKERRQLFYNRKYKKLNPYWDNTMIVLCQLFEKTLKKLRIKGKNKQISVFDAGCGHGNYVVDEYRASISWACGVDLDKRFTKKNISLDEIKYANLEDIPYENCTFNVVLSLWVIEHLENPNKVFKEIYRILKPGGSFIFVAPNRQCLLVIIKKLLGKVKKIDFFLNKLLYGRIETEIFPTFYRANDIKTLTELLKSSGFNDLNLKLNYDPSYTSFNQLSFIASNKADSFFEKFAPHFYKQHIIGYAQKHD